MSRPRAATRASASSSEKTPARQAATYSPTLWPIIAVGLHAPGHPAAAPARTRRRRAPAGRARSRSSRRPPPPRAPGRPGRARSRRSRPRSRPQDLGAAVDLRRERPARARRARGPCRRAARPGPGTGTPPAGRCRPRAARGTRPGSSPAQPRGRPPRGRAHTTTRRWRKARRPDLQREGHVGEGVPGVRARCAARPRRWPRSSAASASARRGRGAAHGPRRPPTAPAGGASSSTTCALVPPMPNELTPARRGPPFAGPVGAAGRSRRTGCPRSRSPGSASRSAGSAGSRRCSSASTVLIRPATPAAASRWPMLVLTEPIAQKPAARAGARTPGSAPRSRSGRRAPCRCRAPRRSRSSPGSTPATARASAITSACPSTPGAVKPTLPAPSLLMAEPRITASIVSPSASASASRLQHDDARRRCRAPCPARRASKARQWPSGEQDAVVLVEVAGLLRHARPRRRRRAPCRTRRPSRLWQARWTATSDVEQAVCTVDARPAQVQLVGDARGEEVLVVADEGLEAIRPARSRAGWSRRAPSR